MIRFCIWNRSWWRVKEAFHVSSHWNSLCAQRLTASLTELLMMTVIVPAKNGKTVRARSCVYQNDLWHQITIFDFYANTIMKEMSVNYPQVLLLLHSLGNRSWGLEVWKCKVKKVNVVLCYKRKQYVIYDSTWQQLSEPSNVVNVEFWMFANPHGLKI